MFNFKLFNFVVIIIRKLNFSGGGQITLATIELS